MKKIDNMGNMINTIIALIGILIIVIGYLVNAYSSGKSLLISILISVGTSILATSIISFLTSYYLVKTNTVNSIINTWKLDNLYITKNEMNIVSNKYLETCKKNIDIIAIGMSSFISNKGDDLKKLLDQGVQIRVISCKSQTNLNQREMDESITGSGKPIGNLYKQVSELNDWINKIKEINPGASIEIKYHSTYPAFSYLRIDNHAFWGPNLYLKLSQQCPAFEFEANGIGFNEFQNHFEKLWNDNDVLSKQFN